MAGGILYICPTPIGNLEDITLRTLNVLREVDLIAAEDTRRTIKLLNFYEISKPLTSYHEHNRLSKGPVLIEKLREGENIGLVSDAGMPGISDPGEELIGQAINEGIEVVVLPGATAGITALVGSGLPTDKFVFEGFLPPKKKDREERLEELRNERRTMIFYESPYRIKDCLSSILKVMGNRRIVLARELTKKYEEILRLDLEEAIEEMKAREIRGEFVLILEGSKEKVIDKEEVDIKKALLEYMEDGYSKSKSVKLLAREYDLPKNQVYNESLDL